MIVPQKTFKIAPGNHIETDADFLNKGIYRFKEVSPDGTMVKLMEDGTKQMPGIDSGVYTLAVGLEIPDAVKEKVKAIQQEPTDTWLPSGAPDKGENDPASVDAGGISYMIRIERACYSSVIDPKRWKCKDADTVFTFKPADENKGMTCAVAGVIGKKLQCSVE